MKIKKKIIHQSLACTPALFNQILIGIGWGWTAPTLFKLQSPDSDFRITKEEVAWIGCISEAGRIIGPFMSPLLLDNIGRKKSLVLVSIMYVITWVVAIFVRDIYILLATRILFGIGNGVTDVASSVYITEVCSPNFRGISGSAIVVAFFVGLIFENTLATYVSYTTANIVNAVVAICAISSQYFGVETAYFLTMKGKHEQAKKTLMWLRAKPDVEIELGKMRKNVEEEKEKRKSFKLLFTSATNLKALFSAVGFYLLFSMVGFHTVTPYASLIFSPSEIFTSNHYTILYGIVQFLASILSLFVIEKIGRRPMIIYSFFVISCCNICTAVLLYLHGKAYDIVFYPWLIFLCLTAYGFVGSLVSPVVYIITGELLPLSVRAIGGSMAISASSIGSFLTATLFWPITNHFGMETNFIIFSAICIVVIIFVYVVVPETRGKALHDMYKKSTEIEHS